MAGVSQSHHQGVNSHRGVVRRGMAQAGLTAWQSAGACAGGETESLSLQGERDCQSTSLLTDEN